MHGGEGGAVRLIDHIICGLADGGLRIQCQCQIHNAEKTMPYHLLFRQLKPAFKSDLKVIEKPLEISKSLVLSGAAPLCSLRI